MHAPSPYPRPFPKSGEGRNPKKSGWEEHPSVFFGSRRREEPCSLPRKPRRPTSLRGGFPSRRSNLPSRHKSIRASWRSADARSKPLPPPLPQVGGGEKSEKEWMGRTPIRLFRRPAPRGAMPAARGICTGCFPHRNSVQALLLSPPLRTAPSMRTPAGKGICSRRSSGSHIPFPDLFPSPVGRGGQG